MIIDPIDIKLIRQLELDGSISMDDIMGKFHITREEIMLRVKNFETTGFIAGYGMKLSVPSFAGGRWYLCCAFTESSGLAPERSVPYLEETIENRTYPKGTGPNVSLLFYTRDLKESYRLVNKLPGLDYAEIYKVGEYNVTIPVILSSEERQALLELVDRKLNYDALHRLIYEPASDADTACARLIWQRKNRRGVIRIFPNLNWSVIKNYAHVHIAVETKTRTRELRKQISRLGFSANIAAKFKKRYLQVEFDLWGFADLHSVLGALARIKRLNVAGCSYAYQNSVSGDWLKSFIESYG